MATIKIRSGYCISVKNADDLKREFTFSKTEAVRTCLARLQAH